MKKTTVKDVKIEKVEVQKVPIKETVKDVKIEKVEVQKAQINLS